MDNPWKNKNLFQKFHLYKENFQDQLMLLPKYRDHHMLDEIYSEEVSFLIFFNSNNNLLYIPLFIFFDKEISKFF